MSDKTVASITSNQSEYKRNYIEIRIETDNSVVVEFGSWNGSEAKFDESEIRLAPGEAHLLSKMLVRHANAANHVVASENALAFGG